MADQASPNGVFARYFGDPGGATSRYYWVQAVYPSGRSILSAAGVVTTPASLSVNNRVLVSWQAMPGAIGYRVYSNTTGTLPSTGSILNAVLTSEIAYSDIGIALQADTIVYSKAGTARFRYDFAVDGGLVGAINPADSDTIPNNAIVVRGVLNSTTAVTSAGAATISVGTVAGSGAASILAATGKASFSLDAVIELLGNNSQAAAQKAPFKMTAAGKLQITVATAALTAGVIEGFVDYYVPASS